MIKVMDDLATALASVDIVLSDEKLNARRQAIVDADATLSKESLAHISFKLKDADGFEALEGLLAKHDLTFARGRGNEVVALIASIALESQIDRGEIDSALLALTARFIGGSPVREETVSKAILLAHGEAKRSRERPSTKLATATVRSLIGGTGALDISDLTTGIRVLSKRLEEVIKVYDERISLMDEEIDVLWWSRERLSAWSDLIGTERAIAACCDLATLVRSWPITAATSQVLHDELASTVNAKVQLSELTELSNTVLALTPTTTNGERSTPLLHILAVARDYEGSADVAQTILKKDGIDLSRSVDLIELTDQLLREFAYLQVKQ